VFSSAALFLTTTARRPCDSLVPDEFESVLGKQGRISVPVPATGAGQIIIALNGGSEAFTAYCLGGEELAMNAPAVVVEQTGPRTVFVTGC
jgi:hypothetical protein